MVTGGTARLALALAPLLVFACAASDKSVAQAPKRSPFHRPATSPKARVRASFDAGADAATPSPQPKTVIVMPPFAGREVFLYPDELEAVRVKLVRALGAVKEPDFVPLPEDKMRALVERTKAGRLLEGGPVCAQPPTLEDVVDAETKKGQDDQTDVASIMLDCAVTDGCTLQVSIGAIEGEREADLMLESKVSGEDAKTNVDRWLAAVDELAQTDELFATGYGTGTQGNEPVVATFFGATGDIGAERPLPSASALAACHDGSSTRRETIAYRPLLSIEPNGTVARCSTGALVPTKRDACICGAFEKLKFGKETKGDAGKSPLRRVVYDVLDALPVKKGARNVTVQATMLDAAGREAKDFEIPALRACCLGAPALKEEVTFDVKLTLDAAGHVTKTDLPSTMPNQLRACLVRAYAATAFSCDVDGQSKVARFSVSAGPASPAPLAGAGRRINEPGPLRP